MAALHWTFEVRLEDIFSEVSFNDSTTKLASAVFLGFLDEMMAPTSQSTTAMSTLIPGIRQVRGSLGFEVFLAELRRRSSFNRGGWVKYFLLLNS